jgi:4-diphosphocytidyl-2-C-methyl-D-erythritol kinase
LCVHDFFRVLECARLLSTRNTQLVRGACAPVRYNRTADVLISQGMFRRASHVRQGRLLVANDQLQAWSPAKINWFLHVIRRRSDGYHDLESLVSKVSLYDSLTFISRSDSEVQLQCGHPAVPIDQRNLVIQAARALADAAQIHRGVTCKLTKKIPIGGGLGGGSSNAATTLLALNELWELRWPVDRLLPIAASLGSDVPLFLTPGSAIISGRGEHVEPCELPWHGHVVILIPDLSVSTAEVYQRLHWSEEDNQSSANDLQWLTRSAAGSTGLDASAWMAGLDNMLEAPAFEVCPQLQQISEKIARIATNPVRVSGSGACLFTAFDQMGEAQKFKDDVEQAVPVTAVVVDVVESAPQITGEGMRDVNQTGAA